MSKAIAVLLVGFAGSACAASHQYSRTGFVPCSCGGGGAFEFGVFDPETNEPLADAEVMIRLPVQNGPVINGRTDAEGRYRSPTIRSDQYQVLIFKSGYRGVSFDRAPLRPNRIMTVRVELERLTARRQIMTPAPAASAPPPAVRATPRRPVFSGGEFLNSGRDSLELVLIRDTDTIVAGWATDSIEISGGGDPLIHRVYQFSTPPFGGDERHEIIDEMDGFLPLSYHLTRSDSTARIEFNDTIFGQETRQPGGRTAYAALPLPDSAVTAMSFELVVRGMTLEAGVEVAAAGYYPGVGFLRMRATVMETVEWPGVAEMVWRLEGSMGGLATGYYVGAESRRMWGWWTDTGEGRLWYRQAELTTLPAR